MGRTGCAFEAPGSAVLGSVSSLGQMKRPSMGEVDQVSQHRRPSTGTRPSIFQDQLGGLSTGSSPSTWYRLGPIEKTKSRGFSIGTPTFGEARPSNNALHLTKVATNGLAPFAGERECWTERGTERLRIRGSEPRGSSKPLVAARDETAQREPRSRRGLSTWSRFSGSLLDHLPGMVGEASTISSQSALLSLDRSVETADRRSPVGTPRP